jgi:hypothetical protein
VDFLQYLSRIDFAGAVLLGVGVVVLALVVHHFLQASVADVISNVLPGLGRWLGLSALDLAHEDPPEAWFCDTCKSLNLAGATVCYRGCGPRPDLAAAAKSADEDRSS